MLVLGGFVLGYLLGARAGREGLEELVDAWNTIRGSEELRGISASAGSMISAALGQWLRQSREVIGGKVAAVTGDGSGSTTTGGAQAV